MFAEEHSNTATNVCHGLINGVPEEFVVTPSDACGYGVQCPIMPGVPQTYSASVTCPKDAPQVNPYCNMNTVAWQSRITMFVFTSVCTYYNILSYLRQWMFMYEPEDFQNSLTLRTFYIFKAFPTILFCNSFVKYLCLTAVAMSMLFRSVLRCNKTDISWWVVNFALRSLLIISYPELKGNLTQYICTEHMLINLNSQLILMRNVLRIS